MKVEWQELIDRALEARKRAYVPYSSFPVGAALLTKDGKLYTGCNIENASYSLSTCAERTALIKAVDAGERDFSAIAVVADIEGGCPPCGACRQIIYEFAPDIKVIMANLKNEVVEITLKELLPRSFKL